MQLGMIGLGRMGGDMALRLIRAGHDLHVYDRSPDAMRKLEAEGASGSTSIDQFIRGLAAPRSVWLMVPVPWTNAVWVPSGAGAAPQALPLPWMPLLLLKAHPMPDTLGLY